MCIHLRVVASLIGILYKAIMCAYLSNDLCNTKAKSNISFINIYLNDVTYLYDYN